MTTQIKADGHRWEQGRGPVEALACRKDLLRVQASVDDINVETFANAASFIPVYGGVLLGVNALEYAVVPGGQSLPASILPKEGTNSDGDYITHRDEPDKRQYWELQPGLHWFDLGVNVGLGSEEPVPVDAWEILLVQGTVEVTEGVQEVTVGDEARVLGVHRPKPWENTGMTAAGIPVLFEGDETFENADRVYTLIRNLTSDLTFFVSYAVMCRTLIVL